MRSDSTSEDMLIKRTVQQMYSLAKNHPDVKQDRMRAKNIEINNKIYTPENFNNIAVEAINPLSASTREFSWGTSFQGHDAPLSNFCKCDVKSKAGTKTYTSAER